MSWKRKIEDWWKSLVQTAERMNGGTPKARAEERPSGNDAVEEVTAAAELPNPDRKSVV